MLKLLFLCSRNQWRSPTAEALYQNDPRVEVQSAGLSPSARRRVTEKLLLWADLILVMETEHKRRLADRFPDATAQIPNPPTAKAPRAARLTRPARMRT